MRVFTSREPRPGKRDPAASGLAPQPPGSEAEPPTRDRSSTGPDCRPGDSVRGGTLAHGRAHAHPATGAPSRDTGRRRAIDIALSRNGFRPASAPGGGAAGHVARARIAQVGDLGAATRVRKGDARSSALVLADFLPTAVTDKDSSTSHLCSSFDGGRSAELKQIRSSCVAETNWESRFRGENQATARLSVRVTRQPSIRSRNYRASPGRLFPCACAGAGAR